MKFKGLLVENREDKFIIDGESLCEYIEIKNNFNTWLLSNGRRQIGKLIKYNMVKGIDYIITSTDSEKTKNMSAQQMSRQGYKNVIIMTLDCAIQITRTQNGKEKSAEVYKYLISLKGNNKEIVVKEPTRLEYQFGDMLEKITGIEWEKQYHIPREDGRFYRLDFYLENTLIIEYDESYHTNQKEDDLERIKYCRDWLAYNSEYYSGDWRCPVIRVKQGEELEGLNRIITHLIGFERLDGYNYGEEMNKICDIGTEMF